MDKEENMPVEPGENNVTESTPEPVEAESAPAPEPIEAESAPAAEPAVETAAPIVTPAPKKSGAIVAIIVALILVAGAAAALAIYVANNGNNNGSDGNGGSSNNNSSNTGDNTSDNSNDDDNGNGSGGSSSNQGSTLAITDAVKSSIYDKIEAIHMTSRGNDGKKAFLKDGTYRTTSFLFTYIPELYKKSGYTNMQKIYTLLANERFYNNGFKKVGEKYKASDFKKYLDESKVYENWDQFKDGVKYIPAETVEKLYKETFGGQIKHENANEICGGFVYDATLGIYMTDLHPGCGGLDFRSLTLRAYKWSSSASEYYVDINVATVYEYEGKNICNVYSGVEENILNDDGETLNKDLNVYNNCKFSGGGSSDYVLTEKDIDGVAKYRYTFDKDYHFVGIKKI